jgi:hypothetical protein
MLSTLAALGFDTGQIVHSVLSDACDAAGALWWIMRKKLGKNFSLPEEPVGSAGPNTGLAVRDPFSDSALSEKATFQLGGDHPVVDLGSDVEEGEESVAMIGSRPTVLLDEVDLSRKKRRHHAEGEEQPMGAAVLKTPPPDLSIVPATPIAAEEVSTFEFYLYQR